MSQNRDDSPPIIAERRSRKPVREDAQPLWPLVLAVGAGLAIAALLAWWLMGRSSSDGASGIAPLESSAPEVFPEEHVEQESVPAARDPGADVGIAKAPSAPAAEPAASADQAATPERVPEVTPESAVGASEAPAQVSVQFTSPDTQVRIELRGPLESSLPLASKVGDIVTVAPGTYRVIASGGQLETFEQEVTLDGERPLEYTVELCAEREHVRENLAGRVVEERECGSTEQCESMFMVLSEYADQLVQDRAFRTEQCAKWRDSATPDGQWTLDIKCGGATLATACRVEIGEGACTFAAPRRSVRGAECPRAELK
ncbi:hypothetical protein HNQ60_002724 [Povalibacter uvarum]|uniref:Uncharacterized protein n=1 Tax=Povalibacter uvarum TaxID=732238 RepID=A0A841HM67_9GAMM|nr:hypothetical protein [Povalibacter uvarum]MBB6093843.1 hypothetical protein [Povalibacter uvarum]